MYIKCCNWNLSSKKDRSQTMRFTCYPFCNKSFQRPTTFTYFISINTSYVRKELMRAVQTTGSTRACWLLTVTSCWDWCQMRSERVLTRRCSGIGSTTSPRWRTTASRRRSTSADCRWSHVVQPRESSVDWVCTAAPWTSKTPQYYSLGGGRGLSALLFFITIL